MNPVDPQDSHAQNFRAGAIADSVRMNAAEVMRALLVALSAVLRMGWGELCDCLDGLLAAAVDAAAQAVAEVVVELKRVADAPQNAVKAVVVGNVAAGSVYSSVPCSAVQSLRPHLVGSLRQFQQKSTGPYMEEPRSEAHLAACSVQSCAAPALDSPAASSPPPAFSDRLPPWPGAIGASTHPHSATGAEAEEADPREEPRRGRGPAEEASSTTGAGVLFVRRPSPAPSTVWKGQEWKDGQ